MLVTLSSRHFPTLALTLIVYPSKVTLPYLTHVFQYPLARKDLAFAQQINIYSMLIL